MPDTAPEGLPEGLLAPAVYENYGEAFDRLLLGSLALAAVAAREWPHGAVKSS